MGGTQDSALRTSDVVHRLVAQDDAEIAVDLEGTAFKSCSDRNPAFRAASRTSPSVIISCAIIFWSISPSYALQVGVLWAAERNGEGDDPRPERDLACQGASAELASNSPAAPVHYV